MNLPFRITLAAAMLAVSAQAQSPVPPDAEIRRILAQRINERHQAVGIVAAVIEPAGTRIVTYGKSAKDDARPLNGDTVFEIGSITKVFTALLLADMAQRGEVKIDDPVSKYLPEGVKAPQRNGKRSPWRNSPPTPRACRGCPTTSCRRTSPTHTPTIPRTSSTRFWRATNCPAIPARSGNTPIWPPVCWAIFFRCAPARTTRRSSCPA
jgi:hypothetical protein